MSKKRITIPVFIAAILAAIVMTFQITAIAITTSLSNAEVRTVTAPREQTESQSQPDTKTDVESSTFIEKVTQKLTELDSEFRKLYIGEIDDEALINSILEGYIYGTGDDFAEYYDEDSYRLLMDDLSGEGEGIGISIIYNSDYQCIEILNIFPNSAAADSGLRVGDLIVAVGEEKEQVSEIGYYVAISKLRGRSGTQAVFTVARGENRTELVDFSITRAPFVEVNVYSRVYSLDDSIGVIKVTGFDSMTPSQFKAAVEGITRKGCDKLILDMRGNPGGELMSIVNVLDYVLPQGPIIRIYDADDNLVGQYDSDASHLEMPMVVLVDHSTASAAELFTAALRDYDMATVVGTTTYGKGCMQTTRELESGGAVSGTYRMFKPPFSESYHKIGIVPDIEVELDEALADKSLFKITDEEDNQLKAAAEAFGSR